MIRNRQKIILTLLFCTSVCYTANVMNLAIDNHKDTATYDNVTEVNRRKRDSNIQCPSNYFLNDGHCYGFVDQSLSWYNARDQCKQIGEDYDLVTIENDEENQFLKDKIRTNFNGNEYWIGAKENNNDNGFVWVDGSDLAYTDWTSGDPNELGNSQEVCVVFKNNREWADRNCQNNYRFICEGSFDKSGWMEEEKKFCRSCLAYHDTIEVAKSACEQDISCNAVYDLFCDGIGSFCTCRYAIDQIHSHGIDCAHIYER